MLRLLQLGLIFLLAVSWQTKAEAQWEMCNKSSEEAQIAWASPRGGDLFREGWVRVKPGECQTLVAQPLTRGTYYFRGEYAEGPDSGRLKWGSDLRDTYFFTLCRNIATHETYENSCNGVGNRWVKFVALCLFATKIVNNLVSSGAGTTEFSSDSDGKLSMHVGQCSPDPLAAKVFTWKQAYGAIAAIADGYAITYNQPSIDDAERIALAQCLTVNRDCRSWFTWKRGECMSVYKGDARIMHAEIRTNLQAARAAADAKCPGSCSEVVWNCLND